MGEKIRDLYPIHIGNAELMIELNEGYLRDEGRLIHIQNPHFRYLLKEKQFVQMAAEVLRSKREMEYVKSLESVRKIKRGNPKCTEPDAQTLAAEEQFAKKLAEKKIDYRLISEGKEYLTFLIKPEQKKAFRQLMQELASEVKELDHPYNENAGYVFLYQMDAFRLYQYKNVYVEIYFQLPCQSLTPKTWIPLDRMIQANAWANAEKKENGVTILDPASKIIFLTGWAVFTVHGFSDKTRAYVEQNKKVLNEVAFIQMLKSVFFNFAEPLSQMLWDGEYDGVLDAYYSFDRY